MTDTPEQPQDDIESAPEFQESPLRAHLGRWSLIYLLLVVAAGLFLYRQWFREGDILGPIGTPLLVRDAPTDRNMWVMPASDVDAGGVVKGFLIHLGNRYHQSVSFRPALLDRPAALELISDSMGDGLTLTSHEFRALPGQDFRVSGTVSCVEGGEAELRLRILARTEVGEPPVLLDLAPTLGQPFSATFRIPPGGEIFRVELVCRFDGKLRFEAPSVARVAGNG